MSKLNLFYGGNISFDSINAAYEFLAEWQELRKNGNTNFYKIECQKKLSLHSEFQDNMPTKKKGLLIYYSISCG